MQELNVKNKVARDVFLLNYKSVFATYACDFRRYSVLNEL